MGRISVTALVVVMVLAGVPASAPQAQAHTEAPGHHHLADPHSRHRLATTQTVAALAEGPSTGRWTAPIDFPLVPAAAALLPNGKVLTWSAYLPDTFTGGTGRTVTAIFDPGVGTVTPRTVTDTGHDMFCPGISTLADGRIVVTGGNNSDLTSVYNPATDTWSIGDRLAVPRGYQSSTILSDGRLFTVGGSWSGGRGGTADLTILHRLPDNGFHAHLLLGGVGIPFQNTDTFRRNLPASAAWDWNKTKPAVGGFNSDGYQDIALLHQLPDNGADIHVLWGGTTPFTYPDTFARHLDASAGWQWSQILATSSP